MPSLDNLLLFVAASVLLVLTPGPNLLYLISRTLAQGRAAGLVSLAGTTTGFVVHILAAALGPVRRVRRGPGRLRRAALGRRRLPAVARLGRGAPGAGGTPAGSSRRAAARRGAREALPDGAPDQHPQSEGRAVLPRALSAVRRSGARQRARAVAGARARPDRHRGHRRHAVRAGGRARRALARHAPGVGGGAALAARRACSPASRRSSRSTAGDDAASRKRPTSARCRAVRPAAARARCS